MRRNGVGEVAVAGLGEVAARVSRAQTAAEIDALWPMVGLRTAVLIVSGAQQAELDPDNAYVTDQSDGEWRMFEQATSVQIDVMTAVIRADLGFAAPPAEVTATVPMINPNALSTRSDWVHTVESPNSFRGKYRGADAARYATEAVAQIEQLVADGRAPAGFICESVYGNAGGMALPDGYLLQV